MLQPNQRKNKIAELQTVIGNIQNESSKSETRLPFEAIKAGTVFKIKNNVYKGKTFTCIEAGSGDYGYKCADQDGDIQFFDRRNFQHYGDDVKIVSPTSRSEFKDQATKSFPIARAA